MNLPQSLVLWEGEVVLKIFLIIILPMLATQAFAEPKSRFKPSKKYFCEKFEQINKDLFDLNILFSAISSYECGADNKPCRFLDFLDFLDFGRRKLFDHVNQILLKFNYLIEAESTAFLRTINFPEEFLGNDSADYRPELADANFYLKMRLDSALEYNFHYESPRVVTESSFASFIESSYNLNFEIFMDDLNSVHAQFCPLKE